VIHRLRWQHSPDPAMGLVAPLDLGLRQPPFQRGQAVGGGGPGLHVETAPAMLIQPSGLRPICDVGGNREEP
jgi:hypothetical protein